MKLTTVLLMCYCGSQFEISETKVMSEVDEERGFVVEEFGLWTIARLERREAKQG